jgi:hypothetical protein
LSRRSQSHEEEGSQAASANGGAAHRHGSSLNVRPMNMKTSLLALLISVCLTATIRAQPLTDSTPAISLFDSVDRVKSFLKDEAKQDYSDKYLSRITLHYFDGHPKKGFAWVYSFSFKTPRLGGDISIYHYMDGKIIEFRHGP